MTDPACTPHCTLQQSKVQNARQSHGSVPFRSVLWQQSKFSSQQYFPSHSRHRPPFKTHHPTPLQKIPLLTSSSLSTVLTHQAGRATQSANHHVACRAFSPASAPALAASGPSGPRVQKFLHWRPNTKP